LIGTPFLGFSFLDFNRFGVRDGGAALVETLPYKALRGGGGPKGGRCIGLTT